MPATSYFTALILEHALLQQDFSIENWYVALFISEPGVGGNLLGEVSTDDYERKAVSWNPGYTNISQIDWAPATSEWGSINYVGLINSPQKGSGNLLLYDETTTSFLVTVGRPLRIPAGGLAVIFV